MAGLPETSESSNDDHFLGTGRDLVDFKFIDTILGHTAQPVSIRVDGKG